MPRKKRRKRKSRPGSPKVAVAYLRVSTEEQRLGPEAQRASIEAWAEKAGVRVAAWFTDDGVSGGTAPSDRKGLGDAMMAVRLRGAGILVVAKRDRLAREVEWAAVIDRELAEAGAIVVSVAGEGTDGDAADPGRVLMRRMADVFAEHERLVIKARTRAALDVKRKRGERLGGRLPYGFRLAADGVHLEPNPAEEAVVAKARALRAGGRSLRGVSDALAALGMLSRKGTPFTLARVHEMVVGVGK